ncbi:MAG: hypothetical protein IPM54_11875 [Polyangiaceae bacterium]|nr:hypothetical protein [Polyangiaceae bacterium]
MLLDSLMLVEIPAVRALPAEAPADLVQMDLVALQRARLAGARMPRLARALVMHGPWMPC